jgi:hypothetical protein
MSDMLQLVGVLETRLPRCNRQAEAYRTFSSSNLTIRGRVAYSVAQVVGKNMDQSHHRYYYYYYGPLSTGRDGQAMGCRHALTM